MSLIRDLDSAQVGLQRGDRGGRIEKPVEYHDSRGYLLYAATEIARLEAVPAIKNDARIKAFHAELLKARAIVGPLLPPERPVKSVARFKAIVAKAKTIALG